MIAYQDCVVLIWLCIRVYKFLLVDVFQVFLFLFFWHLLNIVKKKKKRNYDGSLQCIFCRETGKQNIKQLSEERLWSVKSASERQQDNFFGTVEKLKRDGLVIASHRACISSYTSKTHTDRYLKSYCYYNLIYSRILIIIKNMYIYNSQITNKDNKIKQK